MTDQMRTESAHESRSGTSGTPARCASLEFVRLLEGGFPSRTVAAYFEEHSEHHLPDLVSVDEHHLRSILPSVEHRMPTILNECALTPTAPCLCHSLSRGHRFTPMSCAAKALIFATRAFSALRSRAFCFRACLTRRNAARADGVRHHLLSWICACFIPNNTKRDFAVSRKTALFA